MLVGSITMTPDAPPAVLARAAQLAQSLGFQECRVDWGRDVLMVPGAQGHAMDAANDMRGAGTKLAIDATETDRRAYLGRVRYRPVDLDPYLGSRQTAAEARGPEGTH